ncbi:MAG: alkaline phosphatase family protein, partial [Candidatus Micrarchaeota archaeon]
MAGTPFWRILTEQNIRTTVIRWPVTFPPEKLNGRMLSGLGVVDIKGLLGKYSFYCEDEEGVDGAGNTILVEIENGCIETYVSGPLVAKGKGLSDVKAPMRITIKEENVKITVAGGHYSFKEGAWSEVMRARFKIGFLRNVSGIFRVYVVSTKPRFRMYMTSVQIDPEDPVLDVTYPREYSKELAKHIGLFYTLGMPEETKALTEGRIDDYVFLEQIRHVEEERKRMFFYELNRFRNGVYAFVFDSGDRLQHIFWSNKVLDGGEGLEIAPEIEKYYVEKDLMVGEVLEKIDEDTKLIVLSDHGFSSFERKVNMNNWLCEEGYIKRKTGGGSLLRFVDWEGTKAYALGFTSIYLNLKGREGKGVVERGDKDGLIDELIARMGEFMDPENGKPVFTNIYKGDDVYCGEYAHLAPDIVLGFSEGFRMAWRSGIGELDRKTVSDNVKKWKGDHLIDRTHVPGVVFTNFDIKRNKPEIMDVAPTVLELLGLDIPENMDGKAIC